MVLRERHKLFCLNTCHLVEPVMEKAKQEAESQADRNELLLWAAARGLLADAAELLAQGAEGNIKDKHGLSPAHYAASKGHVDVLQFFSSKGIDLEVEDPKGRTPLHYAALGEHLDTLRYLVSKSSWLEGQDYRDDTPLHLAARRGWVPGLQLLLAAGAKPNTMNKRGLTALGEALAGKHTEAAELLLKEGADPHARAGSFSLLHVVSGLGYLEGARMLLGKGNSADVNDAGNMDGATPLHAAAMGGSLPLVELLLKHGANPAIASLDGLLPSEVVAADSEAAADQLRKRLKSAAGMSSGSKTAAATKEAAVAAAAAATAAAAEDTGSYTAGRASTAAAAAAGADPAASYSAQFKLLTSLEQRRRVDTFSRLSLSELEHLDVLSSEAKEAVFMVSRAHQLLGAFQAVAALRSDAAFQEDAADPRVHQALDAIRMANSVEDYKEDGQVMSVMLKLKKFQSVLLENGAMRVGLKELLLKPGQTLEEVVASDKAQLDKLERARDAARQSAIAAILGEKVEQQQQRQAALVSTAAGETGAAPKAAAASGAGKGGSKKKGKGSEIEELDPGSASVATSKPAAAGQQGDQTELDAMLAETSLGRKEPHWKQQLWKAFADSSRQAIRAIFMMGIMYALMWYLNLLPTQNEEFIRRMDPAAAAAAAGGLAAAGGHAMGPPGAEEAAGGAGVVPEVAAEQY